jgi:hypothetical protein
MTTSLRIYEAWPPYNIYSTGSEIIAAAVGDHRWRTHVHVPTPKRARAIARYLAQHPMTAGLPSHVTFGGPAGEEVKITIGPQLIASVDMLVLLDGGEFPPRRRKDKGLEYKAIIYIYPSPSDPDVICSPGARRAWRAAHEPAWRPVQGGPAIETAFYSSVSGAWRRLA